MRTPLVVALMVMLAGCQAMPRASSTTEMATTPSIDKPQAGLFLGGSVVFEDGGWVQKLYIENHGSSDLLVGENVHGSCMFVGSDGAAILSWDRMQHEDRFDLLRPAPRDQMKLEVALPYSYFLREHTRAQFNIKVTGEILVAQQGKFVTRDFEIDMKQAAPPQPLQEK